MAKIIVIGGGVIGCAVARELTAFDAEVTVLEKSNDVATGTSKANSGIVHAGFDAHPGTLKAKFNVLGARIMESEAKTLDFPFRRNGAFVLNFDADGNKKLEELKAQGELNGVEGLRIMSGDEVREMEPEVSGEVVSALYAPSSGIVGPYEMTIAYAENAAHNGAKFAFGACVTGVEKAAKGFTVTTADGKEYECDAVVNCAGVHSDDINNAICEEKERIVGRKGEYMLLDKSCGGLAYATLFQLPTAMGKGVLVSPTVHGNIIVGPTALDVPDRDDTDTTPDGLNSAWNQAAKSVPSLNRRMIITQFAGVRAHNPKNDFIVGESNVPGFFNALGVESPGLTSAPAIGKYLAAEVAKRLNLGKNAAFNPYRTGIKAFSSMTDGEREGHGTSVVMHISDEESEYLEKFKIEGGLPLRSGYRGRNRGRDSSHAWRRRPRRTETPHARRHGQMSGRLLHAAAYGNSGSRNGHGLHRDFQEGQRLGNRGGQDGLARGKGELT